MPEKIDRQIALAQNTPLGHADGALQNVEQLPYIAGPAVLPQAGPEVGGNHFDWLSGARASLPHKVPDQLLQVLRPFPQRRDFHHGRSKPVKQVPPQGSGLGQGEGVRSVQLDSIIHKVQRRFHQTLPQRLAAQQQALGKAVQRKPDELKAKPIPTDRALVKIPFRIRDLRYLNALPSQNFDPELIVRKAFGKQDLLDDGLLVQKD
jgi:hypothetical protein